MVTNNIRFASFNVSLFRDTAGQLITDLSTPNNSQTQAVAEIIQRVNPDVVLINEFDYDNNGRAAALFQQNYLSVSQNGVNPVAYPFVYLAPSNTGIASGFDLDNNGRVVNTPGDRDYGNDALGFGNFPGQYGMLLLSKYPIVRDRVRTFQRFLWKDMPGALLPDNPNTPAPNDWYSPQELNIFRLSSKSHWDIPINVDGEIIHVLASHPTPPVFDGEEDRNGRRNHDEIRFWSDYVTPGKGDYIYDDRGIFGGLPAGEKFVIKGDRNADPFDGDDQFYVGSGGGNTITGDRGADQFWIATAQLPGAANVITDFEVGVDVVGIGGFAQNTLTFSENNGSAVVAIAGTEVASFLGVSQTQLQTATFVFV